jgi:POT family proton-dependent oligopeptide transporter
VAGTLGQTIGWHYGFAAAGIGMTIALAIYLYALSTYALPPDELERAKAKGEYEKPLTRAEWRAVLALLLLFLPNCLFWATYEQQGNTIALWAEDYTDRTIDLIVWRGEIPTTWFQSFNPFMIFAFTPFVVALWARQARRGREPTSVTKMAFGCFGVALANLVMVGAAWQAGGAPDATWLWLLAYFAIITIGELYLSPVGLSLVSKVSPARLVSMMMGVWLGTSFVGNFLGGWLGSFWSSMEKGDFFLMIAGIAAFAGVVIWSFNRPLRSILR